MFRATALVILAAGVAAGQPPAAPAVAATVNGEPVPLERVDAAVRARFPGIPLTAAQLKTARTDAANDLADDLLVRQFLRAHGPKVEPAEIDRQLAEFVAELKTKGQTLAAFLKDTRQTEADLRASWADLLALHGYVRAHVPDDRLKTYFDTNKDHFAGVEVRAAHVLVRVPATATPTERAAAREKLAAVRADLIEGKLDFAAAARKHSHCPSAARGGDLGFVPRKGGLQDEAFARAAFALKVGELSGVVETLSGFHLIRVTERTAGTPVPFERCLEEVREAFADDFRTELLPRLRREGQVQLTIP